MSVLDDKIRKNRDHFDTAEPPEGHFDRFKEKLEIADEEDIRQKRQWLQGRAAKVAALFVLLISIPLVLVLTLNKDSGNVVAANILPEDIQEVKFYYNDLSDKKMEQVNLCAMESPEADQIVTLARQELENLDSNSLMLESELTEKGENERIVNALIRNYKTKSKLLDNILKRLCNI